MLTKKEKLIINKRSLILTGIWFGLSAIGTVVLVGRQLFPSMRVPPRELLSVLWIPVLSLCMALCMMLNKLLDRRILLALEQLDESAPTPAPEDNGMNEE